LKASQMKMNSIKMELLRDLLLDQTVLRIKTKKIYLYRT